MELHLAALVLILGLDLLLWESLEWALPPWTHPWVYVIFYEAQQQYFLDDRYS